jgi:hypothetical protein
MDESAAIACKPAADYFGLPVEVVERKLKEEAAEREVTARQTTGRAKATVRPKGAAKETTATPKPSDGPEWPSEKWKGSPEELSRKPFAIFAFLRRVWKPFIDETGALVTRQMLIERDRDAGLALKGALRGHRPMPGDIRIVRTRELKNTVGEGPILFHPITHG